MSSEDININDQDKIPTSHYKHKERLAIGLIFGITIIWGSQFILMKQGVQQVPPFLFVGIRHLFAFIGFIPFWLRFRKMNKMTFVASFISAIVFFFLLIFITFGLERTTSNKGAFLVTLYVVFTPLVSKILLKSKLKKKQVFAVTIAVIGMIILIFGGSNSNNVELAPNIGDLLIIVGAIFNAIQIVLIEKYVKKVDIVLFVMTQVLLIAVFNFTASWGFGELNNLRPISGSAYGIMLYMGLVATTLTLLVQTWAQKYLDSTRAALLYSLEPLFATIFGVLIGGEIITFGFFLGASIMMGAILWSLRPSKK